MSGRSGGDRGGVQGGNSFGSFTSSLSSHCLTRWSQDGVSTLLFLSFSDLCDIQQDITEIQLSLLRPSDRSG